jgi:hypothetical protein
MPIFLFLNLNYFTQRKNTFRFGLQWLNSLKSSSEILQTNFQLATPKTFLGVQALEYVLWLHKMSEGLVNAWVLKSLHFIWAGMIINQHWFISRGWLATVLIFRLILLMLLAYAISWQANNNKKGVRSMVEPSCMKRNLLKQKFLL